MKQVWKWRNVKKRKPGKSQKTLLVSTGFFFYSFLFEDLWFIVVSICLSEIHRQDQPIVSGALLGKQTHLTPPPPKPAWGTKMRCWFQLLGRVNLLGERDQRCIHSQWDSASLLFYFVSPDNCMIHAILEADPGNTVCLNQPITISATALILRPCHVCETQDVTTADPALRVPFTPPPPTKNRIYWEPKCFCCGWLPKTRKSSQLNFKAGYLLN